MEPAKRDLAHQATWELIRAARLLLAMHTSSAHAPGVDDWLRLRAAAELAAAYHPGEPFATAAFPPAPAVQEAPGAPVAALARGLRAFAPDLADELVRRWQAQETALEDFVAILRQKPPSDKIGFGGQ